MFELTCKDVLLKTMTTRTNKHGDEPVPAITLKCSIDMPNTVLNGFAPGLLEAMYEARDKAQAELIETDLLPDLKYQHLKPLSLDLELPDYRLLVVNALDHSHNDYIVPECTLKGFKFELKDGGTVNMTFNVNCEPGGDAVAYFYGQQKHNVLISLEAPEQLSLDEMSEGLNLPEVA